MPPWFTDGFASLVLGTSGLYSRVWAEDGREGPREGISGLVPTGGRYPNETDESAAQRGGHHLADLDGEGRETGSVGGGHTSRGFPVGMPKESMQLHH